MILSRVEENVSEERMSVCLGCDSFRKKLKQCKECGCFMPAKVQFERATCPLGKW